MKEAERESKCHGTEYLMLATANTTTNGLFLYRINSTTVNSAKSLRPAAPSPPPTPLPTPSEFPSETQLTGNLLRNCFLYTKTSRISLYWFCKISSCLKPQDAKVADDQYNDIAKCWVNQPLIPGHSWVPITHTDEHQPAPKSTWNDQIKNREDISTDQRTRHAFHFSKENIHWAILILCILIYNLGCA